MKKFCIIFLWSIIISLTALGFYGCDASALYSQNTTVCQEYLRIHIRAHSNADDAQAVKYKVRDGVVEYLTPLVSEYQTKAQATAGITSRLDEIVCVAKRVLLENGFYYGARASVKREKFPTRVYGEFTLPSGEYTALIIELGDGAGDNWWCVVYPPLCFSGESGSGKVIYKSKIAEIIRKFKNKWFS